MHKALRVLFALSCIISASVVFMHYYKSYYPFKADSYNVQAVATPLDSAQEKEPLTNSLKPVHDVKVHKAQEKEHILDQLTPSVYSTPTNKNFCYTTLGKESCDTPLTITGTVPDWLEGVLYYNGPGQFELNNQKFNKTFDGFAMVHSFRIKKKTITYCNKFLDSLFRKEALSLGKLPVGFSKDQKVNWFNKLSALLAEPKKYDNTNMNLWHLNNTLLAITETPHHIKINPQTLSTEQAFELPCKQKAHTNCVHPLWDQERNLWYSLYTHYGHTSEYQLCTVDPSTLTRSVICAIAVDYPAYIHSFAMTRDYIVLIESPFNVNPYDLLGSTKPFIDHFIWKPSEKNRIFIIDKQSGKEVKRMLSPYKAFFFFHIVNAYQEKNSIIIDIIAYPETNIVYSSSDLHTIHHTKEPGLLTRYTINLNSTKAVQEQLTEQPLEFPTINKAYAQKPYRYVYAVNNSDTEIIKYDIQTKSFLKWRKSNCYTSEPYFIERPLAQTEDDGVVLAIITDTITQKSGLIILDAKTLQEKACAWLTHHVPLGYHGVFVNA